MQALEKRISVLEQSSPADTGPVFIHFVSLGAKESEIVRINKGNQNWQRQPNESEQDLKDRAKREVMPPLPGCSTVFLCH